MSRTRWRLCLLASLGVLALAVVVWKASSGARPGGGADGPEVGHLEAAALPDVFEVEITGEEFVFHIRYPGPDGVLWTKDDLHGERDLHVPAGHQTKVHLRSRDYIYNLTLPHLGLKEPAVPGLEFTLEFKQDTPGTFELLGDQMCGWKHPSLLGRLVVEPPERWQAWREETRKE